MWRERSTLSARRLPQGGGRNRRRTYRGGGLILDRSLFYLTGGGQPGDGGELRWGEEAATIVTTIKGPKGAIVLVPAYGMPRPPVGPTVLQRLDWERRYAHMQIHTASHLLSVVIPLPVTGGAITAEKGRLDFDMPQALAEKDTLAAKLNALILQDFHITEHWITDAELEANPSLVKTMSVKPPTGQGRVRLVRIGSEGLQVDLQRCGGTHVARTGEIGPLQIGKIEKKCKQNRRVSIHFAD